MKTKPKVQKAYRLKERTVKLIEWIAEKNGFGAQAETIDMWAEEWVGRKENETPAWWDREDGSEKKLGVAREVLTDAIPGVTVRPSKKVIIPLPDGVITAAKLEKKAAMMGKAVRMLGDDGKFYINGVEQVTNLREERLARASAGPMLRPGQKK